VSTIWTPGGERPVGGAEPSAPKPGPEPDTGDQPTEEELAAQMEELRKQLADAPVELVIANHCFGLFELAALHLSLKPPQLPQAQVAIDALAAVIENLAGRLGEHENQLRDGLAQIRLAYVQLKASSGATGDG
jgi:hypothetical protein